MRRWGRPSVVLLLVAGVACATGGPQEFRALGPVAPDDAYSCALTLLDSLGYTLRASDRASGFLSAERQYRNIIPGQARDVLTVSILKRDDQLTAVHTTTQTTGIGAQGAQPLDPSNRVKTDASLLLVRCAEPATRSG